MRAGPSSEAPQAVKKSASSDVARAGAIDLKINLAVYLLRVGANWRWR